MILKSALCLRLPRAFFAKSAPVTLKVIKPSRRTIPSQNKDAAGLLEGVVESDTNSAAEISRSILKSIKTESLPLESLDPSKIDTTPKVMEKTWSVEILRKYCQANGLSRSGSKSALIGRIRKFWGLVDDKQSIIKPRFQFTPTEFFFVLGKDRSNLERVERECHVKITENKVKNSISVEGEISAVYKAEALLKNSFANVSSEALQNHEITLSRPALSSIAAQIKSLSNTFAIVDDDSSLLLAALNDGELQIAKSIYRSTVDSMKTRPLMIRVPVGVDIGQTLSLCPVADLSWSPFQQKSQVMEVSMMKPAHCGQQEWSLSTIYEKESPSHHLQKLTDFCDDSNLCVDVRLKFGQLLLTPKIGRAPMPLEDFELRYSIDGLLRMFRESSPALSFAPTLNFNFLREITKNARLQSTRVRLERTFLNLSNNNRVVIETSEPENDTKIYEFNYTKESIEYHILNLDWRPDMTVSARKYTLIDRDTLDSYSDTTRFQLISNTRRKYAIYDIDNQSELFVIDEYDELLKTQIPQRYAEIRLKEPNQQSIEEFWKKLSTNLSV